MCSVDCDQKRDAMDADDNFIEDRVANRSFSLQVLTRITLDSHPWLSIDSSVKHPVDENGGKIECLPAV